MRLLGGIIIGYLLAKALSRPVVQDVMIPDESSPTGERAGVRIEVPGGGLLVPKEWLEKFPERFPGQNIVAKPLSMLD